MLIGMDGEAVKKIKTVEIRDKVFEETYVSQNRLTTPKKVDALLLTSRF